MSQPSSYELLMTAAVGDDHEAVSAWDEWMRRFELDDVDDRSFQLLPQVYRRRTAMDAPSPPRLRGVSRHTWLGSQVSSRAVEAMSKVLVEEQIVTLAVGGASRIKYYGDESARSSIDAGLLVERTRVTGAMEALTAAGWSNLRAREPRLEERGMVSFRDREGTVVDLHWQVLDRPDADDTGFWDRARDGSLSPADELLHVLFHGVREVCRSNAPWPLDAAMIISDDRTSVDWDVFLAVVRERELALPVGRGLAQVRGMVDLPVPEHVVRALTDARASTSQRVELWCEQHGSAARHWFRYAREVRSERRRPDPVGFARWLGERYDRRDAVDFVRRKVRRPG